tara:strand:- start:768 stop:1049 length:282 start_codon:yes stop_codon:yes gene_type:complete
MSNCLKCFYYHSESEYGDDYCGYHDKELDTLDSCNNFRISWSDKVNQLEQQLKEANEVAEFYGGGGFGENLFKIYPQLGAKAREYLTKYKVKE